MQATLPVGEMNPVKSKTSRSAGLAVGDVGLALGDCVAAALVSAGAVLVDAGSGESAHPDTASNAAKPAIAEFRRLPTTA